jgi:hypothetical protein
MLGDNNWWPYGCQYCINFCINFGGCMKLSEQITNSCCGVLADKQDMLNKAIKLEKILALCYIHAENMDIGSATLFEQEIDEVMNEE